MSSSSASANTRCACGSIPCAWPAAPLPLTMWSALSRSRTLKSPPDKSVPGQQFQISVRAVGRLSESTQFDDIILKSNADGTLVRLRDVGHAELGAEDYSSNLDYNGHESVGIGITQLSTANALDVDRRCIAELERLSKRFPPGMKYELAFDTTDAVSESIRDVVSTLGQAIFLVILVIFVFLE